MRNAKSPSDARSCETEAPALSPQPVAPFSNEPFVFRPSPAMGESVGRDSRSPGSVTRP